MKTYWNIVKDIKEGGHIERKFDIACIFFAYDNQRLMSLLKDRGTCLA